MQFVIEMAHENVERGTGGPFAAAVLVRATGELVSIGLNAVERLRCSIAHAEVIALAGAQMRLGTYALRGHGLPEHELVATCQPCAMCLGAVGWSGITRLVYAAPRRDAIAIGFDEGLLPTAWRRRLRRRGVEVVSGVRSDEARAVMRRYQQRGGTIYNA
jgi:tRNA(Arg) A34 adenosine deaminase TadA